MHRAGVNRAERIPNPCDIMYQPYTSPAGGSSGRVPTHKRDNRRNSFFLSYYDLHTTLQHT